MPTYRLERCLDRLSRVELYSGQMTRANGATHRVTFQVVEGAGGEPADEAALRTVGERLSRVAHPAVPRLRDVFTLDGRAVWVFDAVDGRRLDALASERSLPARAAFEVGAQLAGALEAAWSGTDRATGRARRMRHEALDASFVFVDRHGVVKLLGIGTGRGEALSPERVLAQEEGLESDVFSLAALLVGIVGDRPLLGDRDEAARRALMVDPKALRAACDEHIDALRERLDTERGVALLRAMTAARKSDRPTMAQVAARCDLISDSGDSQRLVEFATERVPAAPRTPVSGTLEGRSVTTEAPSLWTLTETPPPPPPRSGPPRRSAPTPLPAPSPQTRSPVLGEQPTPVPEPAPAAVASEGPMPWSEAESLALFERTPSLAPPRELQPIVIDPYRIPQLLRQQWDDGVARRYRLAQMAAHLVEEEVDEETPTLVVRDDEPAETPAETRSGSPPQRVEERTVYDAPEVSEAGAGGPRKPVSVPLPVPGSVREVGERREAQARADAVQETPATEHARTPPAFPVPPGLESLVADDQRPMALPEGAQGGLGIASQGRTVPPAPQFQSGPSPTVVPSTDAGDPLLSSEHGLPPANSLAGQPPDVGGGMNATTLVGVMLGGVLGLVAGAAVLYLFFAAGPL